MLETTNPCDDSLNSHAEAAVRHTAILPQIEIPLEGFLRQVVLADPLHQQIIGSHALRTTDDFSVAFRRQNIDA